MALFTEETSLYEILIRVQPGGAWAAHYQTLTEVKKDGIIISSSISDVAPLTDQNAESFAIVKQLLGESAANTLIMNQQMRDQLQKALIRVDELERIVALSGNSMPQTAYASSDAAQG